MIDATDFKILQIIQEEARLSNAEIARRVSLAPSATLERIRKLERKGIVQGYQAKLDPQGVGLGLLAFIFVKTNEDIREDCTGVQLSRLPEVQEVHHVAGEDCYLAKVRVRDPESLGALLREKFGAISTVLSTRTTVVLQTVKESSLLPLTEEGRKS